jgi:hypothetical protein
MAQSMSINFDFGDFLSQRLALAVVRYRSSHQHRLREFFTKLAAAFVTPIGRSR